MYRERKSRTPAKTVTHFLISCIKENGPATATNEPPSQTHNRVKQTVDCEVLVVGAGSSGSFAAAAAAEAGAKTILSDCKGILQTGTKPG